MKLCYIAAGSSTHTMRITNWMAEHGQDVSIISYTPFTLPFHDNIHKHELKKIGPAAAVLNKPRRLWRYNPFLGVTMKRLMLEIRPDITETHYVGPTGMLLAKLTGHHPHVMVCQGSDVLVWPDCERRRLQLKSSLMDADAVVVMSKAMETRVTELTDGMVSRIMVTNTGVDTQKFHPPLNRLRDYCILSSRSLEPLYSVSTLIQAAKLITRPGVCFAIIGSGSKAGILQRMAGQDSRIRFHGYAPPRIMPDILRTCHCYVSTAVSDGTSISLLEAMASDLPCVLTDIPANRPWVDAEYLFKPKDPQDLARVLLYTMDHPPAPGRNRQKVLERADFKVEMKRLEKLYKELA